MATLTEEVDVGDDPRGTAEATTPAPGVGDAETPRPGGGTGAVDGPTSFDEFVEANLAGFRRLAFARLGDWAAAEDLVGDMLADAFRRWDEVGCYDRPAAWARRALLNRSVSVWRRRSAERDAVVRLAGHAATAAEPDAEPRLVDTELWDAVRTLPTRQQQVVLLWWFEDLSVADVAETLECAPDTVRTHWRRARATLAERIGVADDDAGGEQLTGEESP